MTKNTNLQDVPISIAEVLEGAFVILQDPEWRKNTVLPNAEVALELSVIDAQTVRNADTDILTLRNTWIWLNDFCKEYWGKPLVWTESWSKEEMLAFLEEAVEEAQELGV